MIQLLEFLIFFIQYFCQSSKNIYHTHIVLPFIFYKNTQIYFTSSFIKKYCELTIFIANPFIHSAMLEIM